MPSAAFAVHAQERRALTLLLRSKRPAAESRDLGGHARVARSGPKTFTPAELDESFNYLDLNQSQRDGVRAKMADWAKAIGTAVV